MAPKKITSKQKAKADQRVKLDQLPNEVLLSIWQHLEDPGPLSQTNKCFHKLSQDTLWRAKWFMQRFELYDIMARAIAFPKLFTPALLDRLIRLGAPLTRHLAQLLYMYGRYYNASSLALNKRQCVRFTDQAYAAIMLKADSLYGGDVARVLELTDYYTFIKWLLEQYQKLVSTRVAPEPDDAIRQLFNQGFMPLPLAVHVLLRVPRVVTSSKGYDEITQAIVYDPSLASAARRNGYVPTEELIEYAIHAWLSWFTLDEVRKHIKAIMVNGVLNISARYAKQAFRHGSYRAISHPWHFDNIIGSERSSSTGDTKVCELLLELDKQSALPFRLHGVVEEVSASGEMRQLRRSGRTPR